MIQTPAVRSLNGGLGAEHVAILHEMLEEQRRFRIEQLTAPAPEPGTMSEAEREIRETILHAAQLALADVEAALDRMRHGTYGTCVHCGRPLPSDRLEVVPQAALCMPCQQRADILAH